MNYISHDLGIYLKLQLRFSLTKCKCRRGEGVVVEDFHLWS